MFLHILILNCDLLDSFRFLSEVKSGKGVTNAIAKLAGKAQQFNKSVKKASGHLKRLGDENDKERCDKPV